MKDSNDSFLGKGWSFPPAFNFDLGKPVMAKDEDDIKQSIRIILGTIPGERVMFPNFGCPIRKFVFESRDATHMRMLKDAVYDALLYNEPRIKIENIEIDDHIKSEDIKTDGKWDIQGLIHIHITYSIIITNTRNNVVFPFYLKEGTNL